MFFSRRLCSENWGVGISKILDATVAPKQVRRTVDRHYKLFSADMILSPNALSYESCTKARPPLKRSPVAPPPSVARSRDIFHQLDIDPRSFTTNPLLLSHYVTEMGKIKGRDQTMLTLKTQRLLGQTIRRAKMMGVIPNLSRH